MIGYVEEYLKQHLSENQDLTLNDVLLCQECCEDGELVKVVAGGNLENLTGVKEEAQLVLWKEYGIVTPYTQRYEEGTNADNHGA